MSKGLVASDFWQIEKWARPDCLPSSYRYLVSIRFKRQWMFSRQFPRRLAQNLKVYDYDPYVVASRRQKEGLLAIVEREAPIVTPFMKWELASRTDGRTNVFAPIWWRVEDPDVRRDSVKPDGMYPIDDDKHFFTVQGNGPAFPFYRDWTIVTCVPNLERAHQLVQGLPKWVKRRADQIRVSAVPDVRSICPENEGRNLEFEPGSLLWKSGDRRVWLWKRQKSSGVLLLLISVFLFLAKAFGGPLVSGTSLLAEFLRASGVSAIAFVLSMWASWFVAMVLADEKEDGILFSIPVLADSPIS